MLPITKNLEDFGAKITTGDFLMTGIEKEPVYFNEKCFYYVSLKFKSLCEMPDKQLDYIKVGNDEIDYDVLSKITKNLARIIDTLNSKKSRFYTFKDNLVKLVYLNSELIAICNTAETKFLIVVDTLLNQPVSKEELYSFLEQRVRDKTNETILLYISDLKLFSEYITKNPKGLLTLSQEELYKIQDYVASINSATNNAIIEKE